MFCAEVPNLNEKEEEEVVEDDEDGQEEIGS